MENNGLTVQGIVELASAYYGSALLFAAVELDLFAAIFIVCIIINHIQKAFSTLDTRHLAVLKD